MMQALLQAASNVKELRKGNCAGIVIVKHAEYDLHILQPGHDLIGGLPQACLIALREGHD